MPPDILKCFYKTNIYVYNIEHKTMETAVVWDQAVTSSYTIQLEGSFCFAQQ